ncbi:jg18103 [Pararge aegeria aegeria]|uniref:Jg18103 protein n=1 Tax=Pararge aegeria aegeria TaxID=348720 RepID=A0A8S4QU78_9NEOP|nr:jg18103 [Pararge aegeria aegeria]
MSLMTPNVATVLAGFSIQYPPNPDFGAGQRCLAMDSLASRPHCRERLHLEDELAPSRRRLRAADLRSR